jgi:signal transduction histidine kinase
MNTWPIDGMLPARWIVYSLAASTQEHGSFVWAGAVLYRQLSWGARSIIFPPSPLSLSVILMTVVVLLLILQTMRRRRSEQAVSRLTRRIISGSEEERRRIARELHDDIGQRLSLISIQLGVHVNQLLENGGQVSAELGDSVRDVDALVTDVHNLSHQLHSSKLEHLGLRFALKELCQQISERHELPIEFNIDQGSTRLSQDVSLCFYRVAQEALNNIIKHSGTDKVELILTEERGKLRMQVKDFGSGFKPTDSDAGLGLSTMQERLRIIRGELSIASRPGRGTVITAMANILPPNPPQ